jgi:hypothetical protein
LQFGQLTVPAQSFNGEDLAPIRLHGKGQTGVDGCPIKEHGTCPAVTYTAALLDSLQAQVPPKILEKGDVVG